MTVVEAPPVPTVPAAGAATRRPRRFWGWSVAALAALTLLVTGWGVGASMSDYYASIALSMSQSWANFFFGSLDPAGTVTLDKIPGSFWIPALFVKVFGFSAWAVIIPNALAATAATVVMAFTVRRWAGPVAGLVGGAVVATTPILVAVARSNQPETFFVLCLALTAWAATRALERRSLGWLMLAGVFIAAGFQTYMLEAWAVWPALAAAYLCTRQSWWRRVWHLAVAGVTSLALSLVWIVAVSLVPASDRPYIGSTIGNDPWEMVFGYNGLGRFGSATADTSAYRSFTPPFSGDPSVFRLLNQALAAQIGWLIPAAIVAIVILFVLRFRLPLTVFASVFFVTFAAMFSLVAGMHQFYTAALAIPMALLIGTAFAVARKRRSLWAQLALPVTAAVTALGISIGVSGAPYSLPVALVQCAVAVVAVVLVLRDHRRSVRTGLTAIVAAIAMLLTPAVWSVVTIGTPSSINPTAGGISTMGGGGGSGPGGMGGGGMPGGAGTGQGGMGPDGAGPGGQAGMPGAPGSGQGTSGQGTPGQAPGGRGNAGAGGSGAASTATIAWLEEHAAGAKYLAATFGAQSAASLIIASGGQSFLPIGGFNGQDAVPTLDAFEQLVANGDVRYVIVSGGSTGGGAGGGGFGGGSGSTGTSSSTSTQIREWVLENCTEVTDSSVSGVYECG